MRRDRLGRHAGWHGYDRCDRRLDTDSATASSTAFFTVRRLDAPAGFGTERGPAVAP